MHLSLFWKLGETFMTSFLDLENITRILGLQIGYARGTRCPKSQIGLCKASLAHPS